MFRAYEILAAVGASLARGKRARKHVYAWKGCRGCGSTYTGSSCWRHCDA